MMGLNAALPMIIAAHQVACGTCAWCLAGRGWPEQRQLTRHAYPGQPATRTKPPVRRCICWYRVLRDPLGIEYGHGFRDWMFKERFITVASYFDINPHCPHHGRPAELTIEQLWNDPALNVLRDPYDLDDNERSN